MKWDNTQTVNSGIKRIGVVICLVTLAVQDGEEIHLKHRKKTDFLFQTSTE